MTTTTTTTATKTWGNARNFGASEMFFSENHHLSNIENNLPFALPMVIQFWFHLQLYLTLYCSSIDFIFMRWFNTFVMIFSETTAAAAAAASVGCWCCNVYLHSFQKLLLFCVCLHAYADTLLVYDFTNCCPNKMHYQNIQFESHYRIANNSIATLDCIQYHHKMDI